MKNATASAYAGTFNTVDWEDFKEGGAHSKGGQKETHIRQREESGQRSQACALQLPEQGRKWGNIQGEVDDRQITL